MPRPKDFPDKSFVPSATNAFMEVPGTGTDSPFGEKKKKKSKKKKKKSKKKGKKKFPFDKAESSAEDEDTSGKFD